MRTCTSPGLFHWVEVPGQDPTVLPVFSLPDMVQFPGTVLPLHIFEPRYIAMVRDALAADEIIVTAMLSEGADPMADQPPVHDVGCAGRIVHSQQLQDGRYNILLHGVQRVRMTEELPLHDGYRRFKVDLVRRPSQYAIDRASIELGQLESCVIGLKQSVEKTDSDLVEVLSSTSDPIELSDVLSAILVSDPQTRQKLLATVDLRERLRILIDNVAAAMVQVGEPTPATKMN